MTLTWKDPGDARRILPPEKLTELRANRGRWALIRTYPYRYGGRARSIKHPGDVELRFQYHKSGTPQAFTELYARAK